MDQSSSMTQAPAPDGGQCVVNIGVQQRRKRLVGGGVALGVALIASTILVLAGAPRAWLLVVALPLWGAASGFFQYREKT